MALHNYFSSRQAQLLGSGYLNAFEQIYGLDLCDPTRNKALTSKDHAAAVDKQHHCRRVLAMAVAVAVAVATPLVGVTRKPISKPHPMQVEER
ncbi:hypothetical protein BHE74_00017120 [Ensete ventricosum]|nr:hypothetical protein GW17_00004004 [Ensete ventricosum]RWW74891.1 hypothetical protein BHE74_00017120 [Ensete ventricosum]